MIHCKTERNGWLLKIQSTVYIFIKIIHTIVDCRAITVSWYLLRSSYPFRNPTRFPKLMLGLIEFAWLIRESIPKVFTSNAPSAKKAVLFARRRFGLFSYSKKPVIHFPSPLLSGSTRDGHAVALQSHCIQALFERSSLGNPGKEWMSVSAWAVQR